MKSKMELIRPKNTTNLAINPTPNSWEPSGARGLPRLLLSKATLFPNDSGMIARALLLSVTNSGCMPLIFKLRLV